MMSKYSLESEDSFWSCGICSALSVSRYAFRVAFHSSEIFLVCVLPREYSLSRGELILGSMDGSPLSLWKVRFCEDSVESLRSSGYGKKEGDTWLLVAKIGVVVSSSVVFL